MIVRRIATPRAFLPTPCWRAVSALLLGLLLNPPPSPAHAPFDSSARVTVLAQTIEATVTVGTGLAEQLLKDSGGQTLPTTGVGMGTPLPVELANRFFEMEANDQNIPATQLRVLSDGLEALFVVTYPRPDTAAFRLHAQFAKHLPATNCSALVVTDDNNQMLGSHIVKLGSATADFPLPKLPGAIVEATAPAVARIAATAETSTAPLRAAPSQPRWRSGVLIIIAGIVALGSWWLIQRTFCREPN